MNETGPKSNYRETAGLNKKFSEDLLTYDTQLRALAESGNPYTLLKKKAVILENGEYIEIAPVFWAGRESSKLKNIGMYITATNTEGRIEGFRVLSGTYTLTDRMIRVSGMIDIRNTGLRLGEELERKNIELLQDLASQTGMSIELAEININPLRTMNILDEAKNKKDIDAIQLQGDNEKKAWERLYGNGGSLGFTVIQKGADDRPVTIQKLFSPTEAPQVLDTNNIFSDIITGKINTPDKIASEFIRKTRQLIEKENKENKV